MMGWRMGLGLLFTVLFSGALTALTAWLIRVLFPSASQPPVSPTGHDLRADDILDRRLARGEISQEEYDLMRETLSQYGEIKRLRTGGKETEMRIFAIVMGTIALAVVLVVAGFLAGSIWNQSRWGNAVMGNGMMGYGMTGSSVQDVPCIEGQLGYGMMDGNWKDMPFGSAQEMPCGAAYTTPGDGEIASLADVEAIVQDYVERLGYSALEVTEVMEFERNYYAIVAEQDTGIGAMELLVDKDSGAIGPEPGPNMMWNSEYGMMGRGNGMMGMMGGYASGEMTLSPQEAEGVAQRWLDANLPGRIAGEADEFYGYYTLHFLNNGQIEGMLSVHGSSGDVWYHSWHGEFVAMMEGHS